MAADLLSSSDNAAVTYYYSKIIMLNFEKNTFDAVLLSVKIPESIDIQHLVYLITMCVCSNSMHITFMNIIFSITRTPI